MIRIISLTSAGHALAQRIAPVVATALGSAQSNESQYVVIEHKPKPFQERVQSYFKQGDQLIFICAMGIVVRSLAPVLVDKYSDPAVLVLDEHGQFVVPILSGHEGGANQWAYQLSKLIGAQPVLTTANAYVNPIYTLGLGCERNCPVEYLQDLIEQCLAHAALSWADIHSIHSIDLKADEVAMIELAKRMDKPFITWSVPDLREVESQLSIRSDYIFNTVGVYGVAESAALVGANRMQEDVSNASSELPAISPAELVLTKQKNAKATCAIARSYGGDTGKSFFKNF